MKVYNPWEPRQKRSLLSLTTSSPCSHWVPMRKTGDKAGDQREPCLERKALLPLWKAQSPAIPFLRTTASSHWQRGSRLCCLQGSPWYGVRGRVWKDKELLSLGKEGQERVLGPRSHVNMIRGIWRLLSSQDLSKMQGKILSAIGKLGCWGSPILRA